MKKTIIITLTCLFAWRGMQAKSDGADVRLSVTTYNAKGETIATAQGFFVSVTGEAIAPYTIFEGAVRADIVDAQGKKYIVERICGASDLYDVIYFTTTATKAPARTIISTPLSESDVVQVPNSDGSHTNAQVRQVVSYDGLAYYTLRLPADNSLAGAPVYTTDGSICGIIQKSSSSGQQNTYALDVNILDKLRPSPLSAGNSALNAINIPKQLPPDMTEASSYIYLLGKNIDINDEVYMTALQDFIEQYPKESIGYIEMAYCYVLRGDYAQADKVYQTALRQVSNTAEVHYQLSRTIYQLHRSQNTDVYADWTMELALSEIEIVLQSDPQNTLYLLQRGDCHCVLGRYSEAYDDYQQINRSQPSAETYYRAAFALAKVDGDTALVLALMDSAVCQFSQPYTSEAALYILIRGNYRTIYEQYRLAALDYQEYERIVGTENLNDGFFYTKEQVDLDARLYQWALEDIEKALEQKPNDYTYLVEKALIQIMCAQFDEASLTALEALEVEPQGAEAYKMLGIAFGEMGQREAAIAALQHAQEYGDPQAEALLEELLGE